MAPQRVGAAHAIPQAVRLAPLPRSQWALPTPAPVAPHRVGAAHATPPSSDPHSFTPPAARLALADLCISAGQTGRPKGSVPQTLLAAGAVRHASHLASACGSAPHPVQKCRAGRHAKGISWPICVSRSPPWPMLVIRSTPWPVCAAAARLGPFSPAAAPAWYPPACTCWAKPSLARTCAAPLAHSAHPKPQGLRPQSHLLTACCYRRSLCLPAAPLPPAGPLTHALCERAVQHMLLEVQHKPRWHVLESRCGLQRGCTAYVLRQARIG